MQLPCAPAGGKQQEMQVKASKPATQTEADIRRAQDSQRDLAITSAARQEQNCLGQIDAVWTSANRRIKDSETRIAALDRRAAQARNNLAGATWEAGMREEIAGLHQAIATERATATAQASDIRRQCTDQRHGLDGGLPALVLSQGRFRAAQIQHGLRLLLCRLTRTGVYTRMLKTTGGCDAQDMLEVWPRRRGGRKRYG